MSLWYSEPVITMTHDVDVIDARQQWRNAELTGAAWWRHNTIAVMNMDCGVN